MSSMLSRFVWISAFLCAASGSPALAQTLPLPLPVDLGGSLQLPVRVVDRPLPVAVPGVTGHGGEAETGWLAEPLDIAFAGLPDPRLLLPHADRAAGVAEEAVASGPLQAVQAARCRVLNVVPLRLSFDELERGIEHGAEDVPAVIQCPQGHAYRVLPRQDGQTVEVLRAELLGAGTPQELGLVLLSERGIPLAQEVFVGTGQPQDVQVQARLRVPQNAKGPARLALPENTQLLILLQ